MYQLRTILAPRFALILSRYVDCGFRGCRWMKVSFLLLGRVKVIYSQILLTWIRSMSSAKEVDM